MVSEIYRQDLGISKEMWREIYFDKNIISDQDREFLEWFYKEYEGKASASQLTKPYGKHSSSYNRKVGALGKRVANYFNIENIPQKKDGKKEWWNVLFYGENKEKFIWKLRPELKEVINFYKDTHINGGVRYPKGYEYAEGKIKSITLNKYERNTLARKECLEYYGYVCVVCGENLEKKYGQRLGRNFIHVHHEKPLSEIGKEYKVNGIRDLKPVCPNCHSIIHRKRPCFKIEEIKNELKRLEF